MHPDPLVQRPIGTFIALAYSGWNCGHFYYIWMFLVLLLLLLWEMLSNYLSMFQTPRYVSKNTVKPLPKLGTAADDFDSWAFTAGVLLSEVLFFSNKRTRLCL